MERFKAPDAKIFASPLVLHRTLRRMAGLGFLLVFWGVLAGAFQRHGFGGFALALVLRTFLFNCRSSRKPAVLKYAHDTDAKRNGTWDVRTDTRSTHTYNRQRRSQTAAAVRPLFVGSSRHALSRLSARRASHPHPHPRALSRACTHKHATNTHARARAHAHTHTRVRAYTHVRTQTQTQTHARTHASL